MNISTKANTHIKLKRLVESSTLYLIWASIAAVVAIVLNRPAQFGGSTSGLPVGQDFIHGTGTALSPPLVWMLAQALLTWLAWNQMNRKSTWGVIGLALFGATVFVGVLGEPITYELLNPVTFNPLLVVIQAGMIIIPLAMMVFAIQEWRRRWSENQAEESGLIGDLRGCGVRRPRSFLADSCRGSATFGALKAAGMSVDESAEVVADFLDHQAGGDHR